MIGGDVNASFQFDKPAVLALHWAIVKVHDELALVCVKLRQRILSVT